MKHRCHCIQINIQIILRSHASYFCISTENIIPSNKLTLLSWKKKLLRLILSNAFIFSSLPFTIFLILVVHCLMSFTLNFMSQWIWKVHLGKLSEIYTFSGYIERDTVGGIKIVMTAYRLYRNSDDGQKDASFSSYCSMIYGQFLRFLPSFY